MTPFNRQLSPNQKRSGVFISYARSDGSEFAHRLRQQLEQQNIKVWMDRTGMEGNHDWWLQITAAIHGASFLLIVLTPGALESKIVHDEWRYARQEGVCVYIIKGSPDVDYSSLPRWMRNTHCYDLGSLEEGDLSPEWPKFLNDVQKTPDVRRVPFMVEDLPANHVHRSEEFDQLIALLLDRTHEEPIAITAALRGAGGYGKTTIAKSLCHDEQIQDAFDDGILWVTLGETPGDLTGRVEDLIQILSGERPGFTGIEAAITRLTELLADRDILLVIDDVWNRDHLRPFLQGGRRCARLITTRIQNVIPYDAHKVKVDAMQIGEAVELLAAGFENDPHRPSLDEELCSLASTLNEWPLLLRLVNGAILNRVENGDSFRDALDFIKADLEENELTAFYSEIEEERSRAVSVTLGVSFRRLNDSDLARFNELAVFPEDVDIPFATVEKFWAATGNLSRVNSQKLCERLHSLSLLLDFSLKEKRIRLHDVIRKHLIEQQRYRLPEIHAQLLDALSPHRLVASSPSSIWHFRDFFSYITTTHRNVSPSSTPAWSEMPEDEPYLWDHLVFHLIGARRGEELIATVKDLRYLAKKTLLHKSSSVENDLILAEELIPENDALRILRRGFSGSSHFFNRCKSESDLESTILGRLWHLNELKMILEEMSQRLDRPYIIPQSALPDLPHPALIRTLEGHSNGVKSCAFSPDSKQIVSASDDCMLKVWDARTGEMLRTLEGHSGSVKGCAFSSDSKQIVSASDDRTLKVWDARTGEMLRTLEGHSGSVKGCTFSSDSKQIASASDDRTLKVWDAETGNLIHTLEDHVLDELSSLIVLASYYDFLKIWPAKIRDLIGTLAGLGPGLLGWARSPDGELIVLASDDGTLKVRDMKTNRTSKLEGDWGSVHSCAFSPDGRLMVSVSSGRALKVLNAKYGNLIRSFEGHSSKVNCSAFSPDDKLIVSASDDGTLKVWDAQTGEIPRAFEGHSKSVTACSFSPDGSLIVSASSDRTLKIWDAKTGGVLRTLEDHSNLGAYSVYCCAFSPDGRLIVSTSSMDHGVIKIWHAKTCNLIRMIKCHSSVPVCAFSPNGKLIVSSYSHISLEVWDAKTGGGRRMFEGHSRSVTCCAFSPDGKLIVSASYDCTLKVWDAKAANLTIWGKIVYLISSGLLQIGQLILARLLIRMLKVSGAKTDGLICTLVGHSSSVNGCAFSPDSKLIVSASSDRTLRVWAAKTGELIRTLEGHSNSVNGCAFSPDGKLIVSASEDHTLKVWDVKSGKCATTFHADGPMHCCAVHGEMIVAGGARGLYFLRLVR